MATLGNNPGSWSGYQSFYSSNNQVGQSFTATANGVINEIHCYVAKDGSGGSLTLAVWKNGAVIASGTATTGAGSATSGGQGWVAVTGLSVSFSAGDVLTIGWYRSSTNGYWDWSTSSGGSYLVETVSSITGWSGASSGSGSIGAYIVYSTSSPPQVFVDGVQVSVYLDGQILDNVSGSVYLDGVKL